MSMATHPAASVCSCFRRNECHDAACSNGVSSSSIRSTLALAQTDGILLLCTLPSPSTVNYYSTLQTSKLDLQLLAKHSLHHSLQHQHCRYFVDI
jgi:hypothetical protein